MVGVPTTYTSLYILFYSRDGNVFTSEVKWTLDPIVIKTPSLLDIVKILYEIDTTYLTF